MNGGPVQPTNAPARGHVSAVEPRVQPHRPGPPDLAGEGLAAALRRAIEGVDGTDVHDQPEVAS